MNLSFLLDSNVWLDFFLARNARTQTIKTLLLECKKRDIQLVTSLTSLKDVFYLIGAELKRAQRKQYGKLSASMAAAAMDTAWACVSFIRKESFVLPQTESDVLEAFVLRPSHPDLEDNLLIAAATRAQIDYVITSDNQLLKRQLCPCMTPQETLGFLKECSHA